MLCTHKTTILCQFGLFCHQLTTISPSILNHFWWELYQIGNTMTHNNSSLGFLVRLASGLFKIYCCQAKHQTTIRLTETKGSRTTKLAIWVTLHGEQSLIALSSWGILEFNKNLLGLIKVLLLLSETNLQ